ncbi:MAG: CocE/NonD family hydrolase [Actinobacteria bacterium]|uniref:Unannotated protein n=1 Tax=freshwater metagenome TaxID=449393 RepID=A0A6J6RXT0_9ZZZZ|nr:CocE/NonD family hydrolase [Actinomycetota bacterium]
MPRRRTRLAWCALLVTLVAPVLGVSGQVASAAVDEAPIESADLRFTTSDEVSLVTTLSGAAPIAARPTVVEFTPYGTLGRSYEVSSDYNYLLVQIRGTGDSDGTFDALGPRSQRDVVEVLRWACRQPWSDGRLSVAGFSASAIMIFNSLHQKLPCVKASVLRSGTFELYRDLLVPGGILNLVAGAGVVGLIGAPAILAGPDRLGRNPISSLEVALGLVGAGLDAGFLHPTLDDFWTERGFRGNANRIPTLLLDGAFDVEPRGDYQAFQQLRSQGIPAQLQVVGAHDGAPVGTDFGVRAVGRWLDRYLRGVRNGVEDEPAVQMLLADGDREDMLAGEFVRQDAASWPVPGTRWAALSFSADPAGAARSINDGSLTLAPPETATTQLYPAVASLVTNTDPNNVATIGGGPSGQINQLATYVPQLTDMDLSNLTGLTYTTAPLAEPVVAAGPASLDLQLSSTSPTTQIWAVVSDVSPDGTAHPISVGRLSSDFPGVVEDKSLYSRGELVQPYGDYSTSSSALPGEVRSYHVEIWPILNRFKKGHRIQLSLVGQSVASRPGLPAINAVVVGGAQGSRLMFPQLPGSDVRRALTRPAR